VIVEDIFRNHSQIEFLDQFFAATTATNALNSPRSKKLRGCPRHARGVHTMAGRLVAPILFAGLTQKAENATLEIA
jgi:hypothetical protein